MKKLIWGVMGALSLAGCNGVANEAQPPAMTESGPVAALAWVETANAKDDAAKAIAANDYRLWIMAGRGERAPGLSAEQQVLKDKCGKQYLPGSTDVIVSDEHMAQLVKLHNYAAEYNQLVAAKCAM